MRRQGNMICCLKVLSHSYLYHLKPLQPLTLNHLPGDVSQVPEGSGFKALRGTLGLGPRLWLVIFFRTRWNLANTIRSTDYLSHALLSGYSDRFIKITFCHICSKLPTAALTRLLWEIKCNCSHFNQTTKSIYAITIWSSVENTHRHSFNMHTGATHRTHKHTTGRCTAADTHTYPLIVYLQSHTKMPQPSHPLKATAVLIVSQKRGVNSH